MTFPNDKIKTNVWEVLHVSVCKKNYKVRSAYHIKLKFIMSSINRDLTSSEISHPIHWTFNYSILGIHMLGWLN